MSVVRIASDSPHANVRQSSSLGVAWRLCVSQTEGRADGRRWCSVRLTRSTQSERLGADALFLFHGNPAAAPVREIVTAPGAVLPGPPDIEPDRPFRLRLLHFNDLHGRPGRCQRTCLYAGLFAPGRARQTGEGELRQPVGQWAAALFGRRRPDRVALR